MRIPMRSPGRFALIGAVAIALMGASCGTPKEGYLGLAIHPQETSMWCWAASGQMVMSFLGNNVPQCTQANNRFTLTNCPCDRCTATPSPLPGACVRGGWPEFDKYGFTFARTNRQALTWDQLKDELDNGRPVAFSWEFIGGGGHLLVAKGYQTADDGTKWVHVINPEGLCVGDSYSITYEDYVSGLYAGWIYYTHWDDFYQIKPVPGQAVIPEDTDHAQSERERPIG